MSEVQQPSLAEVSQKQAPEVHPVRPEGNKLERAKGLWEEIKKNPRPVLTALALSFEQLRLKNDPVSIEAEAWRWEYRDKERARWGFEQCGVDPEKGLEVVEYFRQNFTVIEHMNQFGSYHNNETGVKKPYFYYSGDTGSVADFVENNDNPIEILSNLSSMVSFEQGTREDMHYVLKYAKDIASVDEFHNIADYLSHFSSLDKISASKIKRSYESRQRGNFDSWVGLGPDDPIVEMSKMVSSSGEEVFTKENALQTESMWQGLFGEILIPINAVPYLSQIAADSGMASCFGEVVRSNYLTTDYLTAEQFAGVGDKNVAAQVLGRLQFIKNNVPEVLELQQKGIEVGEFVWQMDHSPESNQKFLERRPIFQKELLLSAVDEGVKTELIGELRRYGLIEDTHTLAESRISLESLKQYFDMTEAEQAEMFNLMNSLREDNNFLVRMFNKDTLGALCLMTTNQDVGSRLIELKDQLKPSLDMFYWMKEEVMEIYLSLIENHYHEEGFNINEFVSPGGRVTEFFLNFIEKTDDSRRLHVLDNILGGGWQVGDLCPTTVFDEGSAEAKSYWSFIRDYASAEIHTFLSKRRDNLQAYLKDGVATEQLLIELSELDNVSKEDIWPLVTESCLTRLSEPAQRFWKFVRQQDSSDLRTFLIRNRVTFDQYIVDGMATEKLLDDLVSLEEPLFEDALPLLRDDLIEHMNLENQFFWHNLRRYSEMSLRQFFAKHRSELSSFFEADGSPKIVIFERMAELRDLHSIKHLFANTRNIEKGHEHSEFWNYLRNEKWEDLESYGDYFYWLLEQRSFFVDRYAHDEIRDIQSVLSKDFVNQLIVTPERVSSWETLRLVFDRLRQFPELIRGASMLRIAEALGVTRLTARTEVESNRELQTAFVNLFNHNASSFEKRCWNLLRKKLPFTTEEGVRNEMRNQAVVVEEKNQALLSWVHQAVHNYARAQTPDYIRALSGWVNKGDVESLDQLKALAVFYTPDSSPPVDFYTESNRVILQRDAQVEIETLLSLTARYYEVDPSKLMRMIEEDAAYLTRLAPELMSDLNQLSDSLNAAVFNANPGGYGQFLSASGAIRQKIMDLTVSRTGFQKTELVKLDAVISTLHQQTLPQYLDKYIAVEFEKGSLTGEKKDEFIGVFRSTLLSGMLEGDLVGVEYSLKNFGQENLSSESARLHAAVLRFSVELHQANKEWSEFANLAADEMTEMLIRLGHDPSEARSRVIMQDLVNFEKSSYKFLLEPMVEMLYRIDQGGSSQSLESQNILFQYEKDEIPLGSDVVTQFLRNLRDSEKIPVETSSMKDLEEMSAFFNRLTEMPYFKVNALCNVLIPGFYDRSSGERQVVGVRMGRDHYECYPFTHYGVSGVVVLKNGALIEDPLFEIKKIYRYSMVPAMVHAIREGD